MSTMTKHQTPDHLMFKPEPSLLKPTIFDEILKHAVAHDVSDIDLVTDQPVWIKVHGRRYPITRRPVSGPEIREIVNYMYQADASTLLAAGDAINCSHEVQTGREESLRFRVNAVAINNHGRQGVNATLRSLPKELPTVAGLDPEPAIIEAMDAVNGLILVTGPTGSGKSTLLAAFLHDRLVAQEAHRKLTTLEAPIEFDYSKAATVSALVTQQEVGRHIKSFHQGVVEAMRRAPEDILVGESRDVETMAAALEASNTGHLLFTSLHSNGVAASGRRILNFFPIEDQAGRASDIAENLRLIVTQNLVPTVDGKRAAIREFLVFDAEIRDELAGLRSEKWPAYFNKMVIEKGQPMLAPVERLYQEGRIAEAVYKRYRNRDAALSRMTKDAL